MSNPFTGIYFTKNDVWRLIGVVFILVGQFTPRHEYEIFGERFATSELTLVGVAIAIIFPLLMRKLGDKEST